MPVKGFKVITVHDETYHKIKELAESRKYTISHFIEELVKQYKLPPSPPPFLEEKEIEKPRQAIWTWPGPYVQVVTAPQVEHYRSTAWILTEDYPDVVGRPQWAPAIMERIMRAHRGEEDFKIEKMLIISPKAWDKIAVWKWVGEWFSANFAYGDIVKVFVVREKDLENKGIAPKYYDMGIYGDELVGFLTLGKDWARHPREGLLYAWDFDPTKIKESQDAFEKLKHFALARSVIIQQLSSLQGR